MEDNLLSKETKVLMYLYETFGDKIENEYCEVFISDVGKAVLGSTNNIMFLFYCLKSDYLIDRYNRR